MPKPTLGPYLAKNPLLYLYLKILDSLWKFFPKKPVVITSPKKILLVQLAHKGDVILTTSLLPLLKKHYPTSALGMLVSTSSKDIVHNHPLLDAIHCIDHPKLNRASISFFQKCKLYLRTLKKEFPLLKTYDLSIDPYPYYPTSHWITYLAKIPLRVGFQSGGGAPLLTHNVLWSYKSRSLAYDFLDLLHAIGIQASSLKSSLPPFSQKTTLQLQKKHAFNKPYILLHPYAGNPLKHAKDSLWQELAQHLKTSHYTLIFTGGSLEERKKIEALKLPFTKNLAAILSFNELQALVSQAKALICVDTMIAHLAATYDIPSVVLYTSLSDPNLWKPLSSKTFPVYKQDIQVSDILLHLTQLL